MTTKSKKPSEILRPLCEAAWPTGGDTSIDEYARALFSVHDSHHARLTALEASDAAQREYLRAIAEVDQNAENAGKFGEAARTYLATLTPPKPAADDGVEFKGIGDSVYAIVRDQYCVCYGDGAFSDWFSAQGAVFSRTIPRHEAEALRPAIRERFPVKAVSTIEGGFLPSTRPVGEAGQSSESTPLPTPECYPVIHQIGYSRCPACAHLETTSRSVEEGAREFYCKRHAGTRPGDVSDWMVSDLASFANQRTAAVEKERDEWKAKFEKLEARWNTDHAAVYAKLSTVRSERDAAMAKVAELEKVGSFQHAVQRELEHAYAKHGRDPWSRHEFWGVLEEEVDELKDAIRGDMPTAEVIKELRQIACVCQRYAETGDRYRGNHPDVPIRPSTKGAANAPT